MLWSQPGQPSLETIYLRRGVWGEGGLTPVIYGPEADSTSGSGPCSVYVSFMFNLGVVRPEQNWLYGITRWWADDGSLPFFTPVYFSSRDRPKFFRWSLVKPDGIPVTGVNHVNPILLFLCVYFLLFKYIYIHIYLNIYIIYIYTHYFPHRLPTWKLEKSTSQPLDLKLGRTPLQVRYGQMPWFLQEFCWTSDAPCAVRDPTHCRWTAAAQVAKLPFFGLKNFGGIWIVGGINCSSILRKIYRGLVFAEPWILGDVYRCTTVQIWWILMDGYWLLWVAMDFWHPAGFLANCQWIVT